MFRVSLRDRIGNEDIRKLIRVTAVDKNVAKLSGRGWSMLFVEEMTDGAEKCLNGDQRTQRRQTTHMVDR